ncbi:MAG: hypothetical protein AB7S69_17370 [Salinivirgaceae bacterium]
MKDDQVQKLTMFQAVEAIVLQYQPVWAANTVFSTAFQSFQSRIRDLEHQHTVQILPTRGVVEERKLRREKLEASISFAVNRLLSLAHNTNDQALSQSLRYTPSKLRSMRQAALVSTGHVVHELLTQRKDELADYSVTETTLSDLLADISAYEQVLTKPIEAKVRFKGATLRIEELIKDNMQLLSLQMDLELELYKNQAPEFYHDYQSSRQIFPLGRRISMLSALVSDAQSEAPIARARLNFYLKGENNNEELVMVKYSADKGGLRLLSAPVGSYRVVVSKMGYQSQELTLYLEHGQTVRSDIRLEPV